MFDLEQLIRPHLRSIQRYSSARDEFFGEASVYLDANESPFANRLNRYPDGNQRELCKVGSTWLGLDPKQLLFVNGSDEGIDLLIRAFAEPGQDRILISSPTYGMYKVWAEVSGVGVVDLPLKEDFELDGEQLAQRNDNRDKLLFICSPNNPSGNSFPRSEILSIVRNFSGLVVVDEAYIDFASSPSLLVDLANCPNLVILRTFSKAWGFAGLRVGMVIASPSIIEVLRRIKPPYNIGTPAQDKIISALSCAQQLAQVKTNVELLKAERARLGQAIGGLPSVVRVFPSQGNFLLVRTSDSKRIYECLLARGIVVRDRSNQTGCSGCLRVSVGTPDENDILLSCWRSCV